MTMMRIPVRPIDPSPFAFHRRAFLSRYAGAIGTLALAALLEQEQARAGEAKTGTRTGLIPVRPEVKAGLAKPRARSVICLFQHGGPSQMDLFDPKPVLAKYSGKDYPGTDLEIHFDKQAGKLLESPFKFQPRGQSGMEFTELLPRTAGIADELTLIRS